MKKIPKRLLVNIIILIIALSSVIFGSITITRNLDLEKKITTITEERDTLKKEKGQIEEELRVTGEEKVQLEEKVMVLEGEAGNKDAEIAELKKQVTELKKK